MHRVKDIVLKHTRRNWKIKFEKCAILENIMNLLEVFAF